MFRHGFDVPRESVAATPLVRERPVLRRTRRFGGCKPTYWYLSCSPTFRIADNSGAGSRGVSVARAFHVN